MSTYRTMLIVSSIALGVLAYIAHTKRNKSWLIYFIFFIYDIRLEK